MEIRPVAAMFLLKLIWEELHISYEELLITCMDMPLLLGDPSKLCHQKFRLCLCHW